MKFCGIHGRKYNKTCRDCKAGKPPAATPFNSRFYNRATVKAQRRPEAPGAFIPGHYNEVPNRDRP